MEPSEEELHRIVLKMLKEKDLHKHEKLDKLFSEIKIRLSKPRINVPQNQLN